MVTSGQTKKAQTMTKVENALDQALKKITEVEVPQGNISHWPIQAGLTRHYVSNYLT